MIEKTVLAIDPGSQKCGMALVKRVSDVKVVLLWHAVVPTTGIIPKIHEAYSNEPFSMIIIGGGTTSDTLMKTVRDHLPSMAILEVDEENTSLQARERYWEYNERRGWRRILPATLQVPPVPVDDYVAMILAEKVLIVN